MIGHALFNEDFTASSTAGGTTVPVDLSTESVYELPIAAGTTAGSSQRKSFGIGGEHVRLPAQPATAQGFSSRSRRFQG